MHTDMSTETKHEVLARLRRRYASAGQQHKTQLLDQAVELPGYHRKAAIRALRAAPARPRAPALLLGRPKAYHAESLLPVLKPIGFAAFQPCGLRLHALLPEWLDAYEADHHRVDLELRATLLAAYLGQRPRPVLLTRAEPTGCSRRNAGPPRPWSGLARRVRPPASGAAPARRSLVSHPWDDPCRLG